LVKVGPPYGGIGDPIYKHRRTNSMDGIRLTNDGWYVACPVMKDGKIFYLRRYGYKSAPLHTRQVWTYYVIYKLRFGYPNTYDDGWGYESELWVLDDGTIYYAKNCGHMCDIYKYKGNRTTHISHHNANIGELIATPLGLIVSF